MRRGARGVRLIRLAAIIVALAAGISLAGERADRALTKPGAGGTSLASINPRGVRLPGRLAPGSVSERTVPFSRFAAMRHLAYVRGKRAKQLKRSIHAIILGGYGNDWRERAFLCIHSHEGAWNDPNAPFYGGLQMDLEFQRSYGGWALRAFGTADRWPVSVQLSVAIQASLSRGFWPWPNTARACGLL